MRYIAVGLLAGVLCYTGALAQNVPDGLLLDDEGYQQLPRKAPVPQSRNLRIWPRLVSYEAFCPTPINQGGYSTCTSIVLGYYIRTIMEAQRKKLTTPAQIASIAFSPSYIYQEARSRQTDYNCTDGLAMIRALEVMKKHGVAPNRLLGYPACDANPMQFRQVAEPNRIGEFQQILDLDLDEKDRIRHLKAALVEGSPVFISFFAFNTFRSLTTPLWTPTPADEALLAQSLATAKAKQIEKGRKASPQRAHALCLLGYDDNKEGGAFRVVNSYGTAWGDKGFAWIRYADLARYTRYAAQLYPRLGEANEKPLGGLTVGVEFVQTNGTPMPVRYSEAEAIEADMPVYRMTRPYTDHTKFKLILSNNKQTYVQLYGTDEAVGSKLDRLYPSLNFSPLVGSNAASQFPPGKAIELDTTLGTDYLLLVLSEQPLPGGLLERQLAEQQGNGLSLLRRFNTLAALKPIPAVRPASNRIELQVAPTSRGATLPILVLIEHQ
jgi:hypothetical protein